MSNQSNVIATFSYKVFNHENWNYNCKKLFSILAVSILYAFVRAALNDFAEPTATIFLRLLFSPTIIFGWYVVFAAGCSTAFIIGYDPGLIVHSPINFLKLIRNAVFSVAEEFRSFRSHTRTQDVFVCKPGALYTGLTGSYSDSRVTSFMSNLDNVYIRLPKYITKELLA